MHVAVAALGVAAIAYQYEMDFDLRSRRLLLPTHPPKLELLRRDGSPGEVVEVDQAASARILERAAEQASKAKIGWEIGKIQLVPAPKLLKLIKRSRKVSTAEPVAE